MNRKRLGMMWAATALLAVAGLAFAGMAQANGPEFSGIYEVKDVSVSNDKANLTLTVRLFNRGEADVSNATVVLRDRVIPSQEYGAFPNMNVAAGGVAELRGKFEVPQQAYESWQRGQRPILKIEYSDATGKRVRTLIQLTRGRVRKGVR